MVAATDRCPYGREETGNPVRALTLEYFPVLSGVIFFFKTVRIFYIPETTVRVLGALHQSLHSGLSNMELMTDRILGGMV